MSYHTQSSNQKTSKRLGSPNDKDQDTPLKVSKHCSDVSGGIETSSQQQEKVFTCEINIAEYKEKIQSEAHLLKLTDKEVSHYIQEQKKSIDSLTKELRKLSEQREHLLREASKIEETLKDAKKIQEERNIRQVDQFFESYHGHPQTAQRMALLAVKVGLKALEVNIDDGVSKFMDDVELLKTNLKYQPPNQVQRDHRSFSKDVSGSSRGAR